MQTMKARDTPRRAVIVASCMWLFSMWIAFQSGKGWGARSGAYGPNRSPSPGVFLLDIHFEFSAVKDRDRFIELWKPLAKHVREREPGTLSYELAVADSEPLKVLVFERYATKDDYHVHKASKPFEQFHNQLRESGITWASKSGQSYLETGVGFVCGPVSNMGNASFDSNHL